MKKPETHTIDRSIVRQKNEISRDFLDTVLDDLGERPDLPPAVFRHEVQLAAGLASGTAATAKKAVPELSRGARCAALMFVHAWHRNASTFIALDAKLDVELKGEVDPSVVNAPAWIEAMWCALACGETYAQRWLASVPPSKLAPPGVSHGRYAFALGEFLRSLVTHDGRHGHWLVEATEDCDDPKDKALQATRDWVDSVEFPALRAAFHLLDGDAGSFDAAMADLHEQHKRYWSTGENKLAVDGLLSLRGCALLRLAAQLKLKSSFSSGYMPPAVWQATVMRHALHCPYCVLPLADSAPACGPCGRAIKDAPMELAAADAAGTPARCKSCQLPLHKLAVICPQCRTLQR